MLGFTTGWGKEQIFTRLRANQRTEANAPDAKYHSWLRRKDVAQEEVENQKACPSVLDPDPWSIPL